MKKESRKNILYLGPEGSYTEMAAEQATKTLKIDQYKYTKASSVKEIIEYVDNKKDCMGVIPIENSIEGPVRETVDNIIRTKSNLTIFQEITLSISHCLISKTKDISKIRKIISHPQALAQCQNYIFDNFRKFKEIETIKSHSTSKAVQELLELDDTYAAIGNIKAAEIYNLNVIDKQINDEKDNKTRFVCIGYQNTTKTGHDRTSIAFTSANKPGALVDILLIFKKHNINMSYIDSRPSKKFLGEYTFFADLDGHIEDPLIKQALLEIGPYVQFYKLIGSYPKFKQ